MKRAEAKRHTDTDMETQTNHVKIRADLDSSLQVPHNAVPIMPGREKNPWIKGMWLQDEHFILVTLSTNNRNIMTATRLQKRGYVKTVKPFSLVTIKPAVV